MYFNLQLFIPITGDQPANAREAEKSGFGLMLPYQEVTEELLEEKLNLMRAGLAK